MKVKYNKKKDVMVVSFSDKPIVESNEEKPGPIFDYSKEGNMVSIEIINASKQMPFPNKAEYESA